MVGVERGPATRLSVGGEAVPGGDFTVPGFSATGAVMAPVVFAGWGVVSEEHAIDDYEGIDAEGRIVLVRRYTPEDGAFADEALRRRFSDLRYKAFTARERGAVGLLVADLPPEGGEQEEAPLPSMRVDPQGGAGIPIAVIRRSLAQGILDGATQVSLATEVIEQTREVDNIVGRIAAGERLPGAVVLGAHYDHLGFGGASSLAPGAHEPHNGADDNASGTAALLEAARVLAARREELGRDVIFVAFTGEENGLLGSSHFTREPPPGAAPEGLVAMLNMDMVGRLRNDRLSVLGGESAEEWGQRDPAALRGIATRLRSRGRRLRPVGPDVVLCGRRPRPALLHRRPRRLSQALRRHRADQRAGRRADRQPGGGSRGGTDDPGGPHLRGRRSPCAVGRHAQLRRIAGHDPGLHRLARQPARHAAGGRPPRRTGGPGAGLRRGDWIVELSGREIRDIYDLMYVLRESRPGEASTVVVERDGERIERPVTFGESAGVR